MSEPLPAPLGRPDRLARDPEGPDSPSVDLELRITDPDLVAELEAYAEGLPRAAFAESALRIGALALRQARGRLDADTLRSEGTRLIGEIERRLGEHERAMGVRLTGSLKEYFDPESGRFNERVERLVRKDGELENLLRSQIGREDSELGRTLTQHLGTQSPLMKMLDPEESKGILHTLAGSVDQALANQRDRILREFSLDNREGALARLVDELAERHGKLSADLKGGIQHVVEEFSLDNEESALSRLVQRVELAQKRISSEFSLDEEASALARMKRELLEVLESHRQASDRFQQEVRAALAAMSARREESLRSTRHGDDFEADLFGFVRGESQKTGDIATHVGNTTGLISKNKVGDCLIELGPENIAAGARIIVEAKQRAGYNLAAALAEVEIARKNRDAQVGVFVFSRHNAPEDMQPLARYGNDLVVVWDSGDPASDLFLVAALSVARALCTRTRARHEAREADFESIDRAVREVEKQAGSLEEIGRWATTIQSNSEKILDRTRIMRRALQKQVEKLDERIEALEASLETPEEP